MELWKNLETEVTNFGEKTIACLEEEQAEVGELSSKKVPIVEERMDYGIRHSETVMKTDPKVWDELSKKEQKVKNLKQIKSDLGKMAEFRQELLDQGLKPLAIVPTSFFSKLCQKFNLYRFESLDKNGKTGFSDFTQTLLNFMAFLLVPLATSVIVGSLLKNITPSFYFLVAAIVIHGTFLFTLTYPFKKKPVKTIRISLLLGWLIGLLASSYYFYQLVEPSESLMGRTWLENVGNAVFTGVIFIIAHAFFAVIVGLFFSKPLAWCGSFVISRSIFFKSANSLCKKLWPEGIDYDTNTESEKITVKFACGVNEHFSNALTSLKEMKLHPCLATVPEAVKIDKNELTKAMVEKIKNDPILYVFREYKDNEGKNKVDKDFVAVFSQTGKFAPEQEVMEWVQKEGLSCCFN